MPNRPKPSVVRDLQGNPGKRAINHDEPKPKIKTPSAPAYLDGQAKIEWKRITKQLKPLGMLSELDRAALAGYCQAVSEQRHALREMAKHGRYCTNARGDWVRAPWVLTYEKASDAIRKFAAEFGMTPAARTRVAVGLPNVENPAAQPDDELSAARRRRNASRRS